MTPKKNDEKSIDKLKRELIQAWKDIETLPITEIAARNASVFEYCQHWEGRATKAETELEKLRHGLEACDEQITTLKSALREAKEAMQHATESWQTEDYYRGDHEDAIDSCREAIAKIDEVLNVPDGSRTA